MKLFLVLVLAMSVSAWRRSTKTSKSGLTESLELSSAAEKYVKLDLNELLESSAPHPEIYIKAMLELQKLRGKPVCHRMAARLLMDNCKHLNEIDEKNYYLNRGKFEQDQVDAFAATLTMCDMERANFQAPESCLLFTSSSLVRAAETNQKFKFSPQDVNNCLRGLGKNSKHWATWLSYRDSALLFCRAARINIEKDETIALFQKLTVIMENFTSDLHQNLQNLKVDVEKNEYKIDSVFRDIEVGIDEWKTIMRSSFDEISDKTQGVHSQMKDIIKDSDQARSRLESFFSRVLQNNEKMIAEYQKEMDSTASKYVDRLENLNESLSHSEMHASSLRTSLNQVNLRIFELQQQQIVAEKQAYFISDLLLNVTTLLHGHNTELERANSAVSGIHRDLEKVSLQTLSYYESSKSSFALDLSIISVSVLVALLAGNYGLTPTMTGNLILILGGFMIGNLMVTHWKFLAAARDWTLNYFAASSRPQISDIRFHDSHFQNSDLYFQNETLNSTIIFDRIQRPDQHGL